MKKKIKLLSFTGLALGICLVSFAITYYSSDDVRFSRYLNKISNINRSDIRATNFILSKDDIVFKSGFYKESYLMLDLLSELKYLKKESIIDNDINYCYGIWNAIATSEVMYLIELEVNKVNYDIRIIEINIDRSKNKKIRKIRYFKANEKSTALVKELLNIPK